MHTFSYAWQITIKTKKNMLDTISHRIVPSFKQTVEITGTLAGEPFAFSVTLLGQQYPQYLILGLGHQARWEQVLPAVKESESLRLKMVSDEGEMIAARVRLIHASHFPEKLLFVSYPEQGVVRPLRHSPRVLIDHPAQLQVEHMFPFILGKIVDMGLGGFGFETHQQVPSITDELLERQVKLHLRQDEDTKFELDGRVRMFKEQRPNVWHIGIKCALNSQECEDIVHYLTARRDVIDRLIKNDHSSESYSNNTLQA
ncbi:PilZ domain-containing protein [Idiomarina fontislapidosi]|uniref:PilZ domain-containing protein n=2 Tax=Idiomarina fontislapidosi TaxID=263723 RepID=A0A432Y8A9_9GAMM|nr:PilZ domain-containing protein [Idiomarina fontislapidosi]RUO57183.1 hypothetical protein CWE25_05800 [Idiomarina fontislapidosi]